MNRIRLLRSCTHDGVTWLWQSGNVVLLCPSLFNSFRNVYRWVSGSIPIRASKANSHKVLHNMRNYNSTTALLHGLQHISLNLLWVNPPAPITTTSNTAQTQTVNVYSLTSQNVSYLSDPSNNYDSYRHAMKVMPGIPFLLPHIIEYRQRGEMALDELFTPA